MLARHGHLVVVSTHVVVPDGASRFWWEIQDDWAAAGADRVDPAGAHPDRVGDSSSAIGASGLFEEPSVVRHRFDVSRTAAEHVDNLSTQTGVKELPPDAQAELLARVGRRIEAHGGRVTVHHLAVVTVAKRAA